ncbi:condensin-2 complex subunit H2 isoform X3 [Lagenorhynchus albirostris]|uniref:condensin-2 complex subunit H2 isoform X3 n=1 Tax=Lagenorhynchus albirostris TaxID=27610 RepID=UPI0028EE637F|nr:condensin-2 complex subunit H2 isoform X3 [Lagenorhynchus albirostris]
MEDVEARFAHLLQPIRDLTKNWEVDVAAQLGEYLEELDQICISFDEGKTTMNFIEAALLIQGSACVYSKKVEYLYSLVYQALDFISGKKRAKQLSCEREDGPIGDAGSRAPQEVEYEFLSLDDLSDSRANVDLRSDQAPSETLIVPLLPMALVAPDEMEKCNNPLYSCRGEVLASRKDFRMNTCAPHPRGAFMLEPVGMSPTGALLPRNQKEASGRAEEQPVEVSVCRSPVPLLSASQEPEGPVPGGGGEEEDTEWAAEPPEASAPEVPMEPQEPRSPEQSAAQPRRCALREQREALEPASRLKVRAGGAWTPGREGMLEAPLQWLSFEQSSSPELDLSPAAPGHLPPYVSRLGGGCTSSTLLCLLVLCAQETPDPWQGLDPFDSLDAKPFRKGRPYSVPPSVEEAPGQKRKRKGTVKLQDFHQWYLAAYADHADSRRPRRKGPSFADMEVLYWRHVRGQLDTLRKLQRREASTGHRLDPAGPLGGRRQCPSDALFAQAAERWLPRAQEEPWPAEEDRLEDSLEDLGAAAGDFLEPEEYAEPEGAEPGEDADLEAEAMPASLSYEELVRRNVELFIATSQKFVQETELSQRIRDWEDVIQPLLQEQEQHVPFDIHTYGDQVVSRFSQLNQWCPFAELVAGQPAFEVCRSMLASLQLANDYTVEITQQPGLEAAVDTMSLRLLTYQRAHKRFQTYAAPSMVQP